MKDLSDILLKQLGRRAKAGQRTRDLVASVLPDPLADALAFARLDGDCLVLTVATPGAATRMRFCQRDILAVCAKADMTARTLKFKVAPATERESTAVQAQGDPQSRAISEESAARIGSLAENVSCDALSVALKRLASRTPR